MLKTMVICMITANNLSNTKKIVMRNLLLALTAFTLLAQFSCGPTYVVQGPPPAAAPAPPPPAPEGSYQSFYDALSPYGEWINNPDYGYVWMPNVGPDFKPYASNGNWVYTDEGWTWESNYSWGWAPFHYGRWFYEDGYGWMWIPGNEWAPAWVSWRESPDYYGWAPLGPSVSVNVAIGGGYDPPSHYWCFVPHQYVTSPHVNNYYVSERQNVTIINNTTIIHNTTIVNNTVVNNRGGYNRSNYAGGPDPGEVSRFTGAPVRAIAVRETNTPGGNRTEGNFAVYRPHILAAPQGNSGGSPVRPTPSRIQNLNNVRPVNTTIYNNRGNVNNTTINNTTINNNNTSNNNTNNSNTNNSFNNGLRSQPNGQPNGQPQPGFHPVNQAMNQQQNNGQPQPTAQPSFQPGNRPGFQPVNQAVNPVQTGNLPASPANNTRYNNPTPNTTNGNPALTPNTARPPANQNPGGLLNRPIAPATGNGNGQPVRQGLNPNPPKPTLLQRPTAPDTRRKPDTARRGNRP
jgi:hypothetical protein